MQIDYTLQCTVLYKRESVFTQAL